MKIVLTWRALLAFGALVFVLAEAHELVHTGLGRLLCGCWGPRDFNVWSLCSTCATGHPYTNLAATLAGPAFTFAVGWVGYGLLGPRQPVARQSLGFALVLAALPFTRILGAVFLGGNDEVYALSKFMAHPVAWALGGALVLLATGPPLVRAYRALAPRRRLATFLAFFLLPFPVATAVLLGALNSLLASGFLATYGILGSPILITCWTAAVGAVLALTYRHLGALGQPVAALGAPPATFKP
ncbi:hypothetical protein [Hymenobacter coccineus]|uniref:Uncharacterized protein n=1 Tax=Hymenobacter coccineus TaxID=1908235 RepID=A0A1G1T657_9BACT|nr:hypothetical protein [Hymenobacter coccineus]OGX86358.1 hypothetical protein BEN49_10920 [Hymenobacter coccineus]